MEAGDKAPSEMQSGKYRILHHGRSSSTPSIADAVVLKDEDLFFLSAPDGSVPLRGPHGLGLYYHDCRFLNGYELKLGDTEPEVLLASAAQGFKAVLELTNPDLTLNGDHISKQDIGITWERLIDSGRSSLNDRLTFTNYSARAVALPVSLSFQSAFEPLFAVRGAQPEKRGKLKAPRWHDGTLTMVYDGADNLRRTLTVRLSEKPATSGTTARLQLRLPPTESREVVVSLHVAECEKRADTKPPAIRSIGTVEPSRSRDADVWLETQTTVQSDSMVFNQVLQRSLRDLHILKSRLGKEEFFAAGVPWYVALFGRDSLISALQVLAYKPHIAEQTLRLLARRQGRKVDEWRDEQPGKILHELRVGEMARLGEVPQTPYYGSIDSTPLFLVLLGQHAAWTGDLRIFTELRRNVEAALAWIGAYGEHNGDGYIEYESRSVGGLANQGWKDSGDAIVNADGTLAKPPIALAEVQGYVYRAKTGMAHLYRRAGETARADQLEREAADLRARFNRDFWLDDVDIYALALQGDGTPAKVVSSNAGQVLWSGIADADKARRTAERLLERDMFSGWGIRTLSAKERRFNPIGYHLGTVWPHDNSLIAAGLRTYGCDAAAGRVFTALIEAATQFQHDRLPEVFAGFDRERFGRPVRYPVACHPQAWAAGALPFLLETALGLMPEAFERRLRIVRPVLPDLVRHLELHRIRVGQGTADLRFDRASDGAVEVRVLRCDGALDVVVEPRPQPPH